MRIASIGSGNIGKSLGTWFSKLGHEVIFSAHNHQNAEEAAKHAGENARAANTISAVLDADIILLAIPYNAVKEVLPQIKSSLMGKILIDITNPISDDYSSLQLGTTTSAAEEIAGMLPGVHVVKAFNTVFAQVYASQNPKLNDKTISVFYAGDDDEARKKVGELITQMGFDAVDCGPLKSARALEPMALMNITLGYTLKYGTSIGFSLNR